MAHPVRSGMVCASPRTKLSSLPTLKVDILPCANLPESSMGESSPPFPYALGWTTLWGSDTSRAPV